MPVPRVVSVEDDEGIYALLQVTLETLPIEFYHAADGHSAIDLIARVQPDLLLLDIALPDMNGWDVLRTVVEHNLKPHKIIVLTAYTAATHRLIAHFQDVDQYMQKPFSPTELRRLVCSLLAISESSV